MAGKKPVQPLQKALRYVIPPESRGLKVQLFNTNFLLEMPIADGSHAQNLKYVLHLYTEKKFCTIELQILKSIRLQYRLGPPFETYINKNISPHLSITHFTDLIIG